MTNDSTRAMNAREREQFLAIIESASSVETIVHYRQWIRSKVRDFFPHAMLASGIGRITENGIRVHEVIEVDFPRGYLGEITAPDGLVRSPVMLKWAAEKKPQLFEPHNGTTVTDKTWFSAFTRHRLRNIAAHGMCNLNGSVTSYFSFSGIPGSLNPHHQYQLDLLVPHLHTVLIRILAAHGTREKDETLEQLTPRERDVFKLLLQGRTNQEIADTLGLSANTVKNHVRSILVKLDVNNRTQAVLRASEVQVLYSE